MTRPHGATAVVSRDELSLWALGSVLLRSRRLIVALTLLAGITAFMWARTRPLKYASTATFIPQASDASGLSGMAAAASQFGISVPVARSSWGPPMYLALLQSRELIEPMLDDTVVVAERGPRPVLVSELFPVEAKTPGLEHEAKIRALSAKIGATEARQVGGVKVQVTTAWPSVSYALANRLVQRVNDFNLETRKSQSQEELKFATEQAAEAEVALRNAEDRLQRFLQANRSITSPQLTFERDRLQRDVTMRQELQTSWLKAREDARIRAVRDIPVITVFERPRLPLLPESRNVLRNGVLGAIAGMTVGVLLALAFHVFGREREATGDDARQFFALVDELKPRVLRGSSR